MNYRTSRFADIETRDDIYTWDEIIKVIEEWNTYKEFVTHKINYDEDDYPLEYKLQSKTIQDITDKLIKLIKGEYAITDSMIIYEKVYGFLNKEISTSDIIMIIEKFSIDLFEGNFYEDANEFAKESPQTYKVWCKYRDRKPYFLELLGLGKFPFSYEKRKYKYPISEYIIQLQDSINSIHGKTIDAEINKNKSYDEIFCFVCGKKVCKICGFCETSWCENCNCSEIDKEQPIEFITEEPDSKNKLSKDLKDTIKTGSKILIQYRIDDYFNTTMSILSIAETENIDFIIVERWDRDSLFWIVECLEADYFNSRKSMMLKL